MQMFLPLFLAGLVVVIKIQKWAPVVAFLLVGFAVFLVEEWRFGGDLLTGAQRYWFSGPSLFLGFFMLTEPFTMPPTRKLQWWYGAFVGALSQLAIFAPYFRMTPELALVIGNLAFYPSTLRQKLILSFVGAREVARNTWEFSFTKPTGVKYQPGQYLEWMLPHKGVDSRGIRRYFTIASAPSESMLKIGVRFGETISSYKTALKAMKVGDTVIASQLAGDFVLPKDINRKIAMVAGGIGITPFVSQLTEAKLEGERRDVILFSCNNTLAESAYQNELRAVAADVPLRVIEVLAKENLPGHETGFLTADIISITQDSSRTNPY
jgi:ferredoxin-NADP reductase